MNTDDFYTSLPRKRMSAGAIFLDDNGRILLVEPTYKPVWEIPGGVIEKNESPLEACIREVEEEIGLQKRPLRLWCVDYIKADDHRTESIVFIFDGGHLTPEETARITLPADELRSYRFCTLAEAQARLNPRLGKRAAQCLAHPGQTLYLENQEKPFE